MKKTAILFTLTLLAGLTVTMLAGPAEQAVAQGKPPHAGGPPSDGQALLFPGLSGGSCSIDCDDDGDEDFETDADSTIECACDCASVCGGTCEATDGEEVRTCSAT